MKLTISVDGDPAAIEGVLARIQEHMRHGEAVSFKSAIQPESNMGVEGFIEMRASTEELEAWFEGIGLLRHGQRALKLEGQALIDWLKTQVKAMDVLDEKKLPIFAQLYTMVKEAEQRRQEEEEDRLSYS